MKPHLLVTVGLVTKDDSVLVSQRIRGQYAGFWEFPGGKIEPAETSYQALLRELNEELGLEVTVAKACLSYCHDYPDFTVELHVWHVLAFNGDIHGAEGQRWRWVTLKQFKQLEPILRASVELAPVLESILKK